MLEIFIPVNNSMSFTSSFSNHSPNLSSSDSAYEDQNVSGSELIYVLYSSDDLSKVI